jgi:tetratricopeptide (TPR) repeat protein
VLFRSGGASVNFQNSESGFVAVKSATKERFVPEHSLALAPGDAIMRMVKEAAVLRDSGRAADAFPILQLAAEAEPDCAEYFYQLGRAHLDLDHYDHAVLTRARAVDLQADHWAARYWLGVAYVRLQEWEEAEQQLALVAQHQPLFPGGHFYLGVAQEELGKLDDAESSYRRVIVLDPADARTHFFLGCLTAGRAQMDKARVQLEILQALDTDLAAELDECLNFCDALDKLGPAAGIAFVEKTEQDGVTYEVLEARDAASARTFLQARIMKRPGYYVRIVTPEEGTWGRDLDGLHLEHLLPFQIHLRAAKATGMIVGVPNIHSLAVAAAGQQDNYVVEVECGHCHHVWPDALRYAKPTIVRCPSCQTLNRIDP